MEWIDKKPCGTNHIDEFNNTEKFLEGWNDTVSTGMSLTFLSLVWRQ